MIDASKIDQLRYKSEGADLDFKQTQYRLVKGSEAEKAELLKDILAIANSWRDATGYIIVGMKESRPHPAEVVGITPGLDDATLQQFVNGKVKPKLTFSYEEILLNDKTVGVIAIPKQQRPFYISHPFGSLKSNVVYVRRGSSTDEAEPPEVAKMFNSDMGRGSANVVLEVFDENWSLQPERSHIELVEYEELPDYTSDRVRGPFQPLTIWHDNRDFWRDAAEYLRRHRESLLLNFRISNNSEFALSNTTLDVRVMSTPGVNIRLLQASDLPKPPKTSWNQLHHSFVQSVLTPDAYEIDSATSPAQCKARLGHILPGESVKVPDALAIACSASTNLSLHLRILASELPSPILVTKAIEVEGSTVHLKSTEALWEAFFDSYPED